MKHVAQVTSHLIMSNTYSRMGQLNISYRELMLDTCQECKTRTNTLMYVKNAHGETGM